MTERRPDDLIGKTVGSFTILEEVGRGGMATVYSAMQNTMNRKVALKVLPRHFLHDPDFLERFEREVEVISRLEHPHILPIYDYGEDDGVPFIAMRFLGGGSMAQLIRRGVPKLKDIDKPFKQVSEALDYAHQQGIIHRDLKPGNIMLDENGNAYLSDFGIARVLGSNLTGSAIIGTPAYMSPEQAHGGNIDARSDIYSLGIVLFELITGREPYQAETPMSMLLKQINEPIPPIRDFRADVPQLVQDVVDTATAKAQDERYSSATDFAHAFSEALRGERSSTTRINKEHQAPKTFDSEGTLMDTRTPLRNEGGTVVPGRKTEGLKATKIPSAEPHEAEETRLSERRGAPIGMIIGVIVLLLAVVGGGLYFFTDIFKTAPTVALPEDFRLVDTSNYSVGVPVAMMPSMNDFIDESSNERSFHRWQNSDALFVTIAVVNSERMSEESYFAAYHQPQIVGAENAIDNASWTPIDEATAENGMLRRSYRVEGDATLADGQIDTFYMEQGEYLVVVEMYTADAVAGDTETLANLQTILDSLRIKSNT
jgi:serine/threonine protein kinase